MTVPFVARPAPVASDAIVMGDIDGVQYMNTSYVSIDACPLPNTDRDYSKERTLALTRNAKDGVMSMTPEELSAERELDWQLLKQFTKKILTMDLTKFSFPVGYSEPRSVLERMADIFSFLACGYIDKAHNATKPETRLHYLTVGVMAGFHLYMQSKKPWNPVLGETFVGQWDNGVTIFAEQISHHPPISALQIVHPEGKWKCNATCAFTVASGFMEINVSQGGVFHLEFDDGTQYEWEFPGITVLGLIMGERYVRVKGPFEMKDLTNNLICKIDIYPKKDKKKGIDDPRASTVWGGILRAGETEYSTVIRGDYCNSIVADGEEMWNVKTNLASRAMADAPLEYLMPSDSRYRLDRANLIKNNIPMADQAKICIEEMQRREEKLRVSVAPQ